jgi:uncharacterized protein YaaQ
MKLIVTVVDDKDEGEVLSALTKQSFRVTRFSSTGSLLNPGNATLLIGVEDEQVAQAMKMITELASVRQSVVPVTYGGMSTLTGIAEAQVGGFQSFVLNVDHFEQV